MVKTYRLTHVTLAVRAVIRRRQASRRVGGDR